MICWGMCGNGEQTFMTKQLDLIAFFWWLVRSGKERDGNNSKEKPPFFFLELMIWDSELQGIRENKYNS